MIRKATEKDIPSLASLMGELGYPTTSEEMETRFNKIQANPDYNTQVAEMNGEVIGMIGMILGTHYERNDHYIRIVAFVVASNYRNSGIGAALLNKAEEWAIENQIVKLVLNSGNRDERDGAHQFYTNRGFEGKATGSYKILPYDFDTN